MKWLLIIAVTLAGLLIVVIVIGALLPKKHQASRAISLHYPAETVWSLISSPLTWRPEVTNYQLDHAESGITACGHTNVILHCGIKSLG